MSHQGIRSVGSGGVTQPTLGTLLRRLRDARGITRDRLAEATSVSASYITHLENGERGRPTHAVIEALARHLHDVRPLTDAERRHLFDLAGVAEPVLPTVEELRAELSPGAIETLHRHDPLPAAYLDTRSNILFCNDSYRRTFAGIVDAGSILHWCFLEPRSKQVLVEWDEEVARTVALVHGFMGRSERPDWWSGLIDDLSAVPEFQRIWNSGEAAYGRDPAWMTIRDLATDEVYQLDLRLFQSDSVNYRERILFVAGFGIQR
ncbi:hypothetical protein JMUB6875_46390 [Nocardia sp. JMUB6875]